MNSKYIEAKLHPTQQSQEPKPKACIGQGCKAMGTMPIQAEPTKETIWFCRDCYSRLVAGLCLREDSNQKART